MKQVRAVTGTNLIQFAEDLNETYMELSRFTIEKTDRISDLAVLIYYDIPDEVMNRGSDLGPEPDYDIEFPDARDDSDSVTIRLRIGQTGDRHCCECDNYDWGRGCPYRSGHVRQMDPACKMFNIIIEGRF